MVPLRHLALHPQERRPGLAQDRLRPRFRGGRRRTQDEQEPRQRHRPPRHLRPVSLLLLLFFSVLPKVVLCQRSYSSWGKSSPRIIPLSTYSVYRRCMCLSVLIRCKRCPDGLRLPWIRSGCAAPSVAWELNSRQAVP